MLRAKPLEYHIEIDQRTGFQWGVQVREDETGWASIEVHGLTRDKAIHELLSAAKALARTDAPIS
jgi:hypothetical protein